MSKTRAQLVARALSALGIPGAGQTLSAEDYETADELIEPTIALLSSKSIISITDTNEFDDDVFLPLAYILAFQAVPDFGLIASELSVVVQYAQKSETDLRAMSGRYYPSQPITSENY